MQHKKVQAGRLLLLEVCGKGHVGQAGPKVIKWLGVTLNPKASCPYFPRAGIQACSSRLGSGCPSCRTHGSPCSTLMKFVSFTIVCVCVCACLHFATVCLWRSEDTVWESVLFPSRGSQGLNSGQQAEASAFTC